MTRSMLAAGLAVVLVSIGTQGTGLAAATTGTASAPPSRGGELFNDRKYDNTFGVHG